MKIASAIKPKNGSHRPITVHGKEYIFALVLDKDDVPHFVADVKDKLHAETFMAHDKFYAYGEGYEPKPQLQRSAPPAPSELDAPKLHTAAVLEAATVLLAGSASDISKAVGNSTGEIITAALDLEQANSKPRKNVVDVLESTLEGMRAAGVIK